MPVYYGVEPWPFDPVDAAEWLYRAEGAIRRTVSMPDGGPQIAALWALSTWCPDAFYIAPRLFIVSPLQGCGKTTLLDNLRQLVRAPHVGFGITPAKLYALLDAGQYTLLLDEAQEWGKKHGPLVAILNAGHSRATATLSNAKGDFCVFGPLAVASIGNPFERGTTDRGLTIRMRRAMPGENLEKFRADRVHPEFHELARMAYRWGVDNLAALKAADPAMPEGVSGRLADNLHPFLAIADLARGGWSERARAAIQLCCRETIEADDLTAIIRDCALIFKRHEVERIRSADLVRDLMTLDPHRYRKTLSQKALSLLLNPFQIAPKAMRIGPLSLHGYERGPFDDAVERYQINLDDVPTEPAPRATTATTATPRAAVAEFMTILPIAEMVFTRTLEVIEAERLRAESEESPTIIIPPVDKILWCEPFGGTGNIVRQLPPDRRVSYDVFPQDNGELGIIQTDFRTQLLDPAHKWAVLTNMPFGRLPGDTIGAPYRLFEWAAAQPCVVVIAIITPHWFQGPRAENKLDARFHRVHIETLPPESFTHKGQIVWSPTILTVWVRRDYQREMIVIPTTHPDWAWLPMSRKNEANVAIQMWGLGAGDIKSLDALGKINDWRSYKLIKEIRGGTIERLQQINWNDVSFHTLSAPRLYPNEVVSAYVARYGEGAEAASASAAIAAKAGSWPSHLTAAIIETGLGVEPVEQPPPLEPTPPAPSPPSPEGDR